MKQGVEKDCFDGCPHSKCAHHGRDHMYPFDLLPDFCLADPLIDSYEKRKTIKRPCNTCAHRDTKRPCERCVHGS